MYYKINIGSDIFKLGGWVNVDLRLSVQPTMVSNILQLGLRNDCACEVNLGNILEHLPPEDIIPALIECKRIMATGAILYITCPMIDLAEESFNRGEITQEALRLIIEGEDSGPNHHLTQMRSGDLERYVISCGFHSCSVIDLKTFPYVVVSNVKDPKPDPWQYGVQAVK